MKSVIFRLLLVVLACIAGLDASASERGRAVTLRISVYLPERVEPSKREIENCAYRLAQNVRQQWECKADEGILQVTRTGDGAAVTVAPI